MERLKLAVANARFAFYEFAWPKAIRWYKLPNPQARGYRYPAPGSEPINHDMHEVDYKTAYRDSVHNIRYDNDLHPQHDVYMYIQDPIGETVPEKLVRFGFLQRNQIEDSKAVEQASKQYQAELGESPEVKYHFDSAGISERPIEKGNRESVSQFVRQYFAFQRDHNASEAYQNDLDDVYRPTCYVLKSWDMLEDDPVLRQLKVDVELQIENYTKAREIAGQMPIFKGDPNYWKVLDNSFDPETIRQIQSASKDSVTELDVNVLKQQQNKEIRHKYEYLEYPIKNKPYEDA